MIPGANKNVDIRWYGGSVSSGVERWNRIEKGNERVQYAESRGEEIFDMSGRTC